MASIGNPAGGAHTAAAFAANDLFPCVDVSVGSFDTANKTMTQAEMISLLLAMAGPGGRLTLVTATPVMSSDQTAKSTVYYTPYKSDRVPVYTGAIWTAPQFAELSLALNATDNVLGSVYDIFVANVAGTLTLGTGPAWSSTTARGTGASTTELQMLNGVWTNKNSITLRAGGSSLGSFAANVATYLGSIYCTANGQTGMAYIPSGASGGSNNILGLYNAYNRVRVNAMCRDSGSSYTYATATWRAQRASNSNRITFLDGLQQSAVDASLTNLHVAGYMQFGINLDSTSATPNPLIAQQDTGTEKTSTVRNIFAPQLGLHYLQAMEKAAAGTTGTIYTTAGGGAEQYNCLLASLEM